MDFTTKALVEDTKRKEVLSLLDSILKKYTEGLCLSLQVNENASVYTEINETFYLVKNRVTIKGKKRIDKRKVFRINKDELSSLISEYMTSYYGDRLDWVVLTESSTDNILYIDGSIQLIFERTNTVLDHYKTEYIREILGDRSLTVKNLEDSLLEISSNFRIISSANGYTKTQSVIQNKTGTIISTWLEHDDRKELISLSCV